MKMQKKNSKDKPEIFAVNKLKAVHGLDRRKFVGLCGAGLALGALSNNKVLAQNGPTGKKISGDFCEQVSAHSGLIMTSAISPDGTFLATGGTDKLVKIWRLPEGKLLSTQVGHNAAIGFVTFNPESTRLISASVDNDIKVWRVPEGLAVNSISGGDDTVSAVACSPDTSLLATGHMGGGIVLWNLSTGKVLKKLVGRSGFVSSLAISSDGLLLASAGDDDDNSIKLWRLPDGDILEAMDGPPRTVTSMAFSADSTLLAAGSFDRISLWQISDPEAGSPSFRDLCADGAENGPRDEFTRSGGLVFGSIVLSNLRIKQNKTEKPENNRRSHHTSEWDSKTLGLAGLSAVSLLAACDKDDPTSPGSGHRKGTFEVSKKSPIGGNFRNVLSLVFCHNSKMLAAGCSDGKINIWDADSGRRINELTVDSDVRSIVINADDTMLMTASDKDGQGTLKMWHMPDGDPNWCLYDPSLVEQTDMSEKSQKQSVTQESVCTCDLVCTCDTITVAPGTPLTGNVVCICDTIVIGSICTCDAVCTCDNHSAGCGHYWHPN